MLQASLDRPNAAPDVAAAAQEIRRFGSTVIRDAWPRDKLAILREAIATYSDNRAARVAARATKSKGEKMYAAHGVGTFAALMLEELIGPEFLVDLFRGSLYHQICAEVFEDDAFYTAWSRLGFRNHDPTLSDRSYIPYHQDSYTQDARVLRVLNCWIPLDPGAGRDSPGLEVVRDPCRPDFPRRDFGLKTENAAYDFITIARERIVEEYGEIFMAPEFEVGDGLIFSENVIHRTYVTPTMTQPRINFELRIFSPRHLAPGATIAEMGHMAYRLA
jgi:hypothetical protein